MRKLSTFRCFILQRLQHHNPTAGVRNVRRILGDAFSRVPHAGRLPFETEVNDRIGEVQLPLEGDRAPLPLRSDWLVKRADSSRDQPQRTRCDRISRPAGRTAEWGQPWTARPSGRAPHLGKFRSTDSASESQRKDGQTVQVKAKQRKAEEPSRTLDPALSPGLDQAPQAIPNRRVRRFNVSD